MIPHRFARRSISWSLRQRVAFVHVHSPLARGDRDTLCAFKRQLTRDCYLIVRLCYSSVSSGFGSFAVQLHRSPASGVTPALHQGKYRIIATRAILARLLSFPSSRAFLCPGSLRDSRTHEGCSCETLSPLATTSFGELSTELRR